MKTPVQVFDEWIASTAGTDYELPLRFHPIPPEVAEPFNDQRAFFRRRIDLTSPMFLPGREIEIYLDFLDDGTCNAAADIYQGMGLVGIYKGAIMLPLEMFYRMLSHPLVLTNVGNCKLERRGPQHSEGMPTNYDDLIELRKRAKRSPLPKLPNDRTRMAVSQMCIDLVWGFLAVHELVHILHGHIDYLHKSRGIPFLLEVTPSTESVHRVLSKDELDYQSLELWADSKAFSVVLGGFLAKSPDQTLQELFPTAELRLFIWGFAMTVLFRIWGIKIDPAKLGKTHPAPIIRLEMAMGSMIPAVLSRFPHLSEERFWELIKLGQQEAERGIVYCGAAPIVLDDVRGARDPRVKAHADQLFDHFDKVLLTELQQHSYLKMEDATTP